MSQPEVTEITSTIPVTIAAAELPDLFATYLWKACTSCLSPVPESDKPFCLSFDIEVDENNWFATNYLNAHLLNTMASPDGVSVYPLGHETPELTKNCAVAAVSLLGHDILYSRVNSFILANKAVDQYQSYRAHILADGIFIVPSGAFKCTSDIQMGHPPLALLPGYFASQHEALVSLSRFRTGASLLLKNHMRRAFAPETYLPDIRHTAKLPEPKT